MFTHSKNTFLLTLLVTFSWWSFDSHTVWSDDSQLTTGAMSARVDALLGAALERDGQQPAPLCDDATFVRRLTLDLTGRNPTASDVPAFLESKDPIKRALLIDRLLDSPASSVHLANTWSAWLLPDMVSPEVFNGRSGLHTWLRNRFRENLRYDRLVADLLIASGTAASGPGAFFLSLEGKPEKLAAKTSRVFLGVQLDCAECHDHPFDHWKQRDFWGFAAYFARLSADPARMPGGLPEVVDRSEGEVVLPGTEEVIAPRPLVATGLSGLDSGTRRQQLTLWLTARENPYLARAAVNRVWCLMFGRGLIEPIDDMRSLDIATHPELLQELAQHFAHSGYDLRELLRVLANTSAYQRASRSSSAAIPEGSYSVMQLKPLTAVQLATCMQQVARDISGPGREAEADQLAAQLGRLRGERGHAALGIVQALVTLHSEQLSRVHREGQSRLLNALTAPFLDNKQQIDWLYLCTVCRLPSETERAALAEISHETRATEKSTSDATAPSWQADLLWALLNSTEFAMTP